MTLKRHIILLLKNITQTKIHPQMLRKNLQKSIMHMKPLLINKKDQLMIPWEWQEMNIPKPLEDLEELVEQPILLLTLPHSLEDLEELNNSIVPFILLINFSRTSWIRRCFWRFFFIFWYGNGRRKSHERIRHLFEYGNRFHGLCKRSTEISLIWEKRSMYHM